MELHNRLTKNDQELLDNFLGHVLDRYKNGSISRDEAIGDIAEMVVSLDSGGDIFRKFMQRKIAGEKT